MRRDLSGAARALTLPTVALLAIVAFLPGRIDLAVRVYALVLCATVLIVALSALRRVYPPATPLVAAPSPERARRTPPPSLARMEHITALGVAGAFDLHHRLRPAVRALALELVWTRRRIWLDGDPEAARETLGEEAWALVRADRPRPEDRLARGIPSPSLGRVVDSLERL